MVVKSDEGAGMRSHSPGPSDHRKGNRARPGGQRAKAKSLTGGTTKVEDNLFSRNDFYEIHLAAISLSQSLLGATYEVESKSMGLQAAFPSHRWAPHM